MVATYGPKVYHKVGSDELVVASGGKLAVEPGGELENKGTFKSDVIAEATAATGVTADGVLMKDGGVTATAASVFTGVTSSGATVHTGGVKTLAIVLPDADTTILAADSGKIHHIANVSADRTYTLPGNEAGLYYEFWSTLIAADDNDWIIVADNADDFLKGGLIFHDSDAADGIPLLAVPNGTDDHQLTVVLPSVGTCIKYYCDGTNWFISGFVFSTTIPTFT